MYITILFIYKIIYNVMIIYIVMIYVYVCFCDLFCIIATPICQDDSFSIIVLRSLEHSSKLLEVGVQCIRKVYSFVCW